MNKSSAINSYSCSNGTRVSKAVLDRNVRKAKEIKTRNYKNDHGFISCEFTGQSSGTYFDIMHIISVNEAQNSGRSELCWDQRNLRFGTREIHKNHDKKTSAERDEIFNELNK